MSEYTKKIDKELDKKGLFSRIVVPSELKTEFATHDELRWTGLLEIALVIGLVIYLSFSAIDWIVAPDVFWIGLAIRSLFVLPLGLLTLYVLRRSELSLRFKQSLGGAMTVVVTIVFIAVTAMSHAEYAPVYLTGANVVLVFVVSMMSIPFALATTVSVLIIAIESVGALVTPFASLALFLVTLSLGVSTAAPVLYANWCLQNERRRQFLTKKRDELRLETIAEQRDQLNQLAGIDPLTGIANRRGLDTALAEKLDAAGPAGSIAVAMIDIDFFKPFNDGYGHPAGDRALRKVAMTLRQSCDPAVLVARLGGEEFVAVWISADAIGLAREGESLRHSIESLRIPHTYSRVHDCLTISLGMSNGMIAEEAPIAVFSRADKALYQAKNGGRNRVVIHDARQAAQCI